MRRFGRLLVLGCATSCSSILGIHSFQLGEDAPVSDIGDGAFCYGTLDPVCLVAPPSRPFNFSAAGTVDTDDPTCVTTTQPSGVVLCVIPATDVDISAAASIRGAHPLAIVATGNVTLGAIVDASSVRAGTDPHTGAGAMFNECSVAGNGSGNGTSGTGGGAGGSFGSVGGNGGSGLISTPQLGGIAGSAMVATHVRGGCPGGNGGMGTTAGGSGGDGGGAIYVIAGTSITITAAGAIFASGSHGNATGAVTGGGGGGTGGMIALDAPTISIGGNLVANGAGGAGGSTATPGGVGTDGTTTTPTVQATGGAGAGGFGGNGGKGTSSTLGAGSGTNATSGGGGGGGGGDGSIWIAGTVSAINGVVISPSPH